MAIKSIITSQTPEEVVKILKTRFKKISEQSRLKVLKSLRIANKKGFSIFVKYREIYAGTNIISYIKIGNSIVYTNNEPYALPPGMQTTINF